MSRPRTFEMAAVVEAAKQLFWTRGYGGAGVDDIEVATGLGRSSLYHAFGSKEGIFDAALANYVATFIGPLFAPMERAGARPVDVERYFATLATRFGGDPAEARRGCLWVNSIAEFSGREPPVDVGALPYRVRLHDAFHNALLGGDGPLTAAGRAAVERRSRVLTVTTVGLWHAARFDAPEAAVMSHSVRAEVRSWRLQSRA